MSAAVPRVVIIGLDGADWSLLRPLFADGVMPTLKAFVEAGVSATLESVRPTNSMSGWASLMTGVNPGKHGLYDFVRGTGTPFETVVTNSSVIRFPTIWETLTAAGLYSCVIDMPPLDPPFAINGVMLGGIGATGHTSSVASYPAEAGERVRRAVGAFVPDVTWTGKAGHEEELVDDLIAHVENRQQVAEFFLSDSPVDLFSIVFVAPDRLQHVFWQDLIEQRSQYALARRFYAALDEALARLLDRLDLTVTDVLFVSDHGFRRFQKMLNVNQLFVEMGWSELKWADTLAGGALRFVGTHVPLPHRAGLALYHLYSKLYPSPGGPMPRLLSNSIAYSEMAEGVNINLKGRESTGRVPQDEFDNIRNMVAAGLLEFREQETDEPVVKRLIKREEYFHGEYAGEAPDLLLEFHDGYSSGAPTGKLLYIWPWCQGVHSRAGIISGLGPHFRRNTECPTVSILDVTPTVLSLLGVSPPEGTDGRIAQELLTGSLPATDKPSAPPPERRKEPSAYSEEEEAVVRERLRGLGYIE